MIRTSVSIVQKACHVQGSKEMLPIHDHLVRSSMCTLHEFNCSSNSCNVVSAAIFFYIEYCTVYLNSLLGFRINKIHQTFLARFPYSQHSISAVSLRNCNWHVMFFIFHRSPSNSVDYEDKVVMFAKGQGKFHWQIFASNPSTIYKILTFSADWNAAPNDSIRCLNASWFLLVFWITYEVQQSIICTFRYRNFKQEVISEVFNSKASDWNLDISLIDVSLLPVQTGATLKCQTSFLEQFLAYEFG